MEGEIINKFIIAFKSLIENVKLLCPRNSIINNNAGLIDSFVSNNKELIIKIYCQKVLIYKNKFDENPEEFLLNHNFKEDLKDLDDVPIDQIFIFKNIWKQLSQDNKNILINYINGLNKLSLKYLNI